MLLSHWHFVCITGHLLAGHTLDSHSNENYHLSIPSVFGLCNCRYKQALYLPLLKLGKNSISFLFYLSAMWWLPHQRKSINDIIIQPPIRSSIYILFGSHTPPQHQHESRTNSSLEPGHTFHISLTI